MTGCGCSPLGPPGSTGVTSFNGRTGAVVAVAGDYTSTQVTNASGVAGATVSAALDTLNTGKVPTTRNVNTTAPLAGGGALSADLTLSVATVSNTTAGVAPQTNGTLGQVLTSAAGAGAPTWGTNFGAQNLVTTGVISLGTTPALTGTVRLPHGGSIIGRNNANAGDRTIVSWGVVGTDEAVFGDTAAGTYRILSSGQQDAYIGANRQYSLGASLLNLRPDSQVSYDITLEAQPMIGLNAGSSIRNLAFFAVAATNFNVGNRIFYAVTATTAPNANPTGGSYFYVDPTTQAFQWITPAGTMPVGTTNFATTVVGNVGSALVGTANCLRWDTNKLGLYNSAPVALQTVTGSRTGVAAAAPALTDLLAKLATLGAIIDGSTP